MSNISNIFNRHNTILITSIAGILLIAILVALPTGYEDALIYKGTERAIGKVIETDNQAIISSGLVQTGEQSCSLLIMNGRYKGQTLTGVNFLSGSLEKDKIFKKGDKALLTISFDGDEIKSVVMSDNSLGYIRSFFNSICRKKWISGNIIILNNCSYDMESACSMLS